MQNLSVGVKRTAGGVIAVLEHGHTFADHIFTEHDMDLTNFLPFVGFEEIPERLQPRIRNGKY